MKEEGEVSYSREGVCLGSKANKGKRRDLSRRDGWLGSKEKERPRVQD